MAQVIVPIVATALANGSRLVRVIVAKPQSKQMAQMLISKFGGLVNRRVYYLPFSRSLRLTRTSAKAISEMLHECLDAGGILLVQPEHLLSFKLMALECFINDKTDVGQSVASTQHFLDCSSRDIVDEADENFSTRFELIYTIGLQTAVEMSPDRWLLLQQILHLVRQYAPHVRDKFKSSIEVNPGPAGSFPRIRLLREDAENEMLKEIANHIVDHGLDGFRVNRQASGVREAIYTYVTKRDLDVGDIRAVEEGQIWTDTTRSHLLMLRGLLALGVLGFILGQKRYRVNYGLTTTRTPSTKLAVPFRAKDSPAPRSEFSHPDVVILLTHLSYYYQGLDDEDLFAALGHLMNSDQAETEYWAWIKDSHSLPAAFKQLLGINLKDRAQCAEELFPFLRGNKGVIDYFLSHLVLPKEMKEFSYKLSASGWDIGKSRKLLTTGFSGTVDSHPLLPLSMMYRDLPKQRHTNALVLEYLLQSENAIHEMSNTGATSDAEHLLHSVMRLDPTPEVILDLGAQILELSNLEMAKTWLGQSDSSKEAVIFVNDNDEICIVDRHDRIALWQNSSYQSRPDACLVFLDESHTRGTDLKLPKHYRAAVTLGARVTKDRLVQACMRMRKLGKGQSVVFCVSEEIQAKIRDATMKPPSTNIELADVLVWSILESHSEIRRSMPLWATQGERFVRQEKLWKDARSQSGELLLTKEYANKFLEKEGQTIEERYRPRQSPAYLDHFASATDTELQQIYSKCREFDDLQYDSSTLHEEQERELSPEIEQERQIERAPPAKHIEHTLHPHVLQFAMNGAIVPGSKAYGPAFSTLQQLSVWKLLAKSDIGGGGQLLATTDFAMTVEQTSASFKSDAFLRPVQWILTRCAENTGEVDRILIISPYEANELYGRMKETCGTTLHVYKPRVNSSYAALDALDFHFIPPREHTPSVPRLLAVQLNLFAGQLYVSSHEDYLEICKVLGLLPQKLTEAMEKQGWKVQADGFILCDDQGKVGGDSKLKKSPVAFLKALMSIRRNGDDISKTHMGGLVEGKLFEASDFEA